MYAEISTALENSDQDNSQTQPLEDICGRAGYLVGDVGRTIFTKSQILAGKWGLPSDASPVENILKHAPDWVNWARVSKGSPGRRKGSESLWLVVDFAAALAMEKGKKKWKVPVASLNGTIRRDFPSAWEDWGERRLGLE